MYEIHPELLWIGNALDVRDPKLLFETGIAAVVDVAYEEAPAQCPRELIYCRFPLNDGGGNNQAVLTVAIKTVVDLLLSGTPTLVACSAGMSRSPTIAAAALSIHLDESPVHTMQRIGTSKTLELSAPLWKDVVSICSKIRSAE